MAIVDLVDAGAGANGTLEICTTSFGSVLLTFDCAAPAFGSSTIASPIYIGGVQATSASITGTRTQTQTTGTVGAGVSVARRGFNGQIDLLRWTPRVCRYPDRTTFTPPTDYPVS